MNRDFEYTSLQDEQILALYQIAISIVDTPSQVFDLRTHVIVSASPRI